MGKPQKAANLGEDLHEAARSGDLNAVQLICSTNPLAVNSRDKHSRTPYPSSSSSRLHLAAWSGQAQVVSCLCKNKVDVGAAAMDDMGAIHFAAQKGHLEVVRILVSSGVSVKACNRKGMTALHYAAQGSHLELIKYLLKKGASLSAKTKAGKTPIDIASSEDVRSILLDYERESKKVDLGVKGNMEETGQKSSPEERAEVSGGEEATAGHEAGSENDESVKRKGDENGEREDLPEMKKAKVVLSHLDMDDQPDEEENQ